MLHCKGAERDGGWVVQIALFLSFFHHTVSHADAEKGCRLNPCHITNRKCRHMLIELPGSTREFVQMHHNALQTHRVLRGWGGRGAVRGARGRGAVRGGRGRGGLGFLDRFFLGLLLSTLTYSLHALHSNWTLVAAVSAIKLILGQVLSNCSGSDHLAEKLSNVIIAWQFFLPFCCSPCTQAFQCPEVIELPLWCSG